MNRSAISGRFVKKRTVQRTPKTTVTQTIRTGKKSDPAWRLAAADTDAARRPPTGGAGTIS